MAGNQASRPSEDASRQLDSTIAQLQRLHQSVSLSSEEHETLERALTQLRAAQAEINRTPNAIDPISLYQYELVFKALVENAPDMIARVDRNHRYLYVNPRVEEITGLPAQAFIGKTNEELKLPSSLIAQWEPQVTNVFETGQQRQFQFDSTPRARERHFDVRLAPELDRHGAVSSVLAIVRDISEQEWARRSLARYARRLQFLNEVSRAIRSAYSAEAVAEAVLPYTQHLLDCPRASVALYDREAGEALLLAVHTGGETRLGKGARLPLEWNWLIEDLERGKIGVIENLEAHESPETVLEALRAEGVQSMISVPLIVEDRLIGSLNLGMPNLEPLSDENVEIAREMADQLAIAIHQTDLTQRVREHASALEQSVARRTTALRASEARFRAVLENAAMGIALVDMDGRVMSSNPALQRMLGYDAAELKGMNISQFTHPDDFNAQSIFADELIAGKRASYRIEKRYIRKDGTILWVRPTVSLVKMPQNKASYIIKLVDDISEEKRMREALIQAEKLNIAGQLGASLAHEISNPLQSVIGSLGLAAEMLKPEDDVNIFIGIAIEELERAAEIVAQLRDISRKSPPKEKEPAQLNQLVEKVLLLNKKRCETQKIEIEWHPEDDLPTTALVSDRIRQVFLNLMLNAVEAMPKGGRLQVCTTRTAEPQGIAVSFTDNGSGIEPDLLAHLFEPFRSSRPEGMGLGLHISKTIVEEHDGRIEVESKVGQGTTFTVWLPLQEVEENQTSGGQDG